MSGHRCEIVTTVRVNSHYTWSYIVYQTRQISLAYWKLELDHTPTFGEWEKLVWLDRLASTLTITAIYTCMPSLGDLLQPQLKKKRTVAAPRARDLRSRQVDKYCLQHQEEDSEGDVKTELYKVWVGYTSLLTMYCTRCGWCKLVYWDLLGCTVQDVGGAH